MSINKNTWIYLNKCNYEEWYKFIGTNCIIQIPLTIKDRESIINNHKPVELYKKLKIACGQENQYFIRLSTRSIKDAFYNQTPIPLHNPLEIIERVLKSKRAYIDIKYSI